MPFRIPTDIKTSIYSGFSHLKHPFIVDFSPKTAMNSLAVLVAPGGLGAQEGLHYGAQLAVCYDGQMVHFSVGEVWESGHGKKFRDDERPWHHGMDPSLRHSQIFMRRCTYTYTYTVYIYIYV